VASARAYAGISSIGFVALIDTSMISPVIASYALSLGADELTASVIAAIYSMIAIPMSAVAGLVVDKISRRGPLVAGLVADAVVMIGYLSSPSPFQLLLSRAVHAVADSFVVPSALAAIGDTFQQALGKTLAFFWTFVALAIVAGSGSATAIVSRFGFAGVFGTVAVLIGVVAAYSLIANPLTLHGKPVSEGSGKSNTVSGFAVTVAAASFSMLALYLVIGGVVGTLPSILVRVAGMEERFAAAQIGIFMALSTGLSIPSFFASARIADRYSPFSSLLIGLIAVSISSALLQLGVETSVLRLVAALVFSVALGFVFHGSSHAVLQLPRDARGKASGILNAFGLLGVAVGAPLTAIIAASGILTGPFGTLALVALPVIALVAYAGGRTRVSALTVGP
jgi:MFS family permease